MKPEVYLRCDGGSSIGLGHLVRCLALAHMLKDDFEVIFFCKEIPFTVQQEIENANFEVTHLKDEEDFFQYVTRSGIVVLDGYQFDATYQKKVKKTGAQLVLIDDLLKGEFFADLIINQVPAIVATRYSAQPYTHFALGPEYVLLRKPFLKAATEKREQVKTTSMLICFGGADPENFTDRALSVALSYKELEKVEVVVGHAYAFTDLLYKKAASDSRVTVHRGLAAQEMVNLFLQTQLAIVPSSGILLEAIATHSNIIAGYYIDNQRLVYEAYKNSFIDAGNFAEAKIEKAITQALKNRTRAATEIDGLSGKRLVKRFMQLTEVTHIKIRKATLKDLDITYQWASNPAVRAYSFQQQEIRREEHEAWFQRKLQDVTCVYFLVEWKSEIIGSVRYDVQDNQASISYLVDPHYHSKGFGLILLSQSFQPLLDELKVRALTIHQIVGYVMKDNYPSRKTFVNLGFTEFEENGKLKFVKQV